MHIVYIVHYVYFVHIVHIVPIVQIVYIARLYGRSRQCGRPVGPQCSMGLGPTFRKV